MKILSYIFLAALILIAVPMAFWSAFFWDHDKSLDELIYDHDPKNWDRFNP